MHPYAPSIMFLACAWFCLATGAQYLINYARLLLGGEGVLYLVEKTAEGGTGLRSNVPRSRHSFRIPAMYGRKATGGFSFSLSSSLLGSLSVVASWLIV